MSTSTTENPSKSVTTGVTAPVPVPTVEVDPARPCACACGGFLPKNAHGNASHLPGHSRAKHRAKVKDAPTHSDAWTFWSRTRSCRRHARFGRPRSRA
jgi:hypothetical protein